MKLRTLSTLALTSSILSSCIYYTNPVPEMPYRPYKPNPALSQGNNSAFAAATQYEGAWYTTPPTGLTPMAPQQEASIPPPAAASPKPVPELKPATIAKPAAGKPSSTITQPQLKPVTPKPVAVKPAAPAAKPAAPAPAAPKDPKSITNTGPIPVATPVPGDPTRVYNPLDSSKTIRITDKNGKIYPSGKELKVRGTNFHFYVP